MSRTRVEDIIDVVSRIRDEFSAESSFDISAARNRAIGAVAESQFRSGRFSSRYSAERSIHDACTRRLSGVGDIYSFESLTQSWLASGSNELYSAVKHEARSQRDEALVDAFFRVESIAQRQLVSQSEEVDTKSKAEFSDGQLRLLTKLYSKCKAQAQLVIGIQDTYLNQSTPEDQKKHIETTIGAGLWYIKASGIWSGFISKRALESFRPDSGIAKPKLTSEHNYPRKIAATELLNRDWSSEKDPGAALLWDFVKKYGQVHYVTKTENRSVSKYQRDGVFSAPEEAYRKAGIELIQIDDAQLKRIKNRDGQLIESLLSDSV